MVRISSRESFALSVFSSLSLLSAVTVYINSRSPPSHSLHKLDLNKDDLEDMIIHDLATHQDYAFFQQQDGTYRRVSLLYYQDTLVYLIPLDISRLSEVELPLEPLQEDTPFY